MLITQDVRVSERDRDERPLERLSHRLQFSVTAVPLEHHETRAVFAEFVHDCHKVGRLRNDTARCEKSNADMVRVFKKHQVNSSLIRLK